MNTPSGFNEDFIIAEMPLERKIQGHLFFRLLVGVFFLVLTLVVQSRRKEDLLSTELQPLYFFSCILFLFTIIAALGLKRVRRLERFAYAQLLFDVGAVTVLIFLSGGVDSLFSFLYTPVIISAAVLLYRRGSLLTASACSVCYGLLLDLQYFGWLSPLQIVSETTYLQDSGAYFHNIVMNIAGFYLVGFLSGYLAEELQKSSRKVREQRKDLHQLEALHRNIVHSIGSGLLTVGVDGVILFSNTSAQDILGIPSDLLKGRPFSAVFPSLDTGEWPREPSREIKRPASERLETVYRRPQGEQLFLGYTVSVLQNGDDGWGGWIFIFQDLTRLKIMEEHLKRLDRLAFAGRISAEIAHEIKNPLAAMSGAVQMLQNDSVFDAVQTKLIGIVHREIERINKLVTDFLWLTKGAHGAERQEAVPVCEVIEEVIELLKARNHISSTHSVRTSFSTSPTLFIDPHHFRQILWNLILNALEAMPEGGETLIGVSGNEHETRIDIEDSGPGIPEEVLGRIFEPFFTTKGHGTGLGLSIVYQLLERANGRIEVTPKGNGSGTAFSLFFPLTPSLPLAN